MSGQELLKSNLRIFFVFSIVLLVISLQDKALATANDPNRQVCYRLRVNGSENPVGIDDERFRLSWILPSQFEVDRFQVVVGTDPETLNQKENLFWDSGERKAADCNVTEYRGNPVPPSTRVYWQVRVWPVGKDKPTTWSEIAYWETGLGLDADAWEGSEWIAHVKPMPEGPELHNELFRKVFELPDKAIASARLYVGTPGFFQAWVNGQQLSNIPCDPIPSRSLKRIYYRTFDIGNLLNTGKQTIGLRLFSGYYSLAHQETEHEFPVIRALLKISYNDGTFQTFGTNESWKVTEDFISLTQRYEKGLGFGKEIWDMDDDPGNWTASDYDDSEWVSCSVMVAPSGQLTGQPPVGHIIRKIHKPDTIIQLGINRVLLDFGKVITGRIHGKFKSPHSPSRMNEIRVQYFDHWPHENIYNQTDEWRSSSERADQRKEVEWKPIFNLRCFRYVEIEHGNIGEDWTFVAEEIGNLRESTVEFSSSNGLLDTLYHTGLHTLKMLSINGIVTDCSHREKDGWGAEVGANLELLCSHFDAEAFLLRYMRDCRDASFHDGRLPAIIPYRRGIEVSSLGSTYYYGNPIEMAWKGYLYYGNPSFIEENFKFLYDFVEYTTGHLKDGIIQPYHFSEGYSEIPKGWIDPRGEGPIYFLGDWLSPGMRQDNAEASMLFNTAYLIYISKMVQQMAVLLNKKEEKKQLDNWINKMSVGIRNQYVNDETGKVYDGRQPYPVVVLLADFLPEELNKKVYKELKRTIIEEDNRHFNTGVAATSWLLEILMERGDVDLALSLLSQRDYPSLGNFIEKGYTTYPSSWDYKDAMQPSFCHTSYSGTSFWFLEALAGIKPDMNNPGLKSITLAPQFTKKLPGVECSINSFRGLIESSWRWVDDSTIEYTVIIPNGSNGNLVVPQGFRPENDIKNIKPGKKIIRLKKL